MEKPAVQWVFLTLFLTIIMLPFCVKAAERGHFEDIVVPRTPTSGFARTWIHARRERTLAPAAACVVRETCADSRKLAAARGGAVPLFAIAADPRTANARPATEPEITTLRVKRYVATCACGH